MWLNLSISIASITVDELSLGNKSKDFKISNDGVAYLDVDGVLKYFYKGKSFTVSHETVSKYYVNNDVVWYLVGVNTWKVFYSIEFPCFRN